MSAGVTVSPHRDWCLVGSANASIPAWGKLESGDKPWGPVNRVESWEAGVLMPPVLRIDLPAGLSQEQRQAVLHMLRACGQVSRTAPGPHPFAFDTVPHMYGPDPADPPFTNALW